MSIIKWFFCCCQVSKLHSNHFFLDDYGLEGIASVDEYFGANEFWNDSAGAFECFDAFFGAICADGPEEVEGEVRAFPDCAGHSEGG